jgi:putative membrane protein
MMDAVMQSLWSGLPALLSQFLATAAIYTAGLAAYLWLTPFHELALVRKGNAAAAITLSGAILGLAIPLGATLANSVSLADIMLWGAVSAALQALTFGVVSLVLRDLAAAVERGEIAAATVAASAQLAVGILNAGAMSS